ncbi:MAG: hypothetical protein JAY64_19995 [Candidatus Thiodiazotropha weberae]|nr:hypothetical protein [Candidatus Thiodiazotropha lotti]MCW4213442.1 hypothetical protein [Candidatus Thiodiazotropha lotti]
MQQIKKTPTLIKKTPTPKITNIRPHRLIHIRLASLIEILKLLLAGSDFLANHAECNSGTALNPQQEADSVIGLFLE